MYQRTLISVFISAVFIMYSLHAGQGLSLLQAHQNRALVDDNSQEFDSTSDDVDSNQDALQRKFLEALAQLTPDGETITSEWIAKVSPKELYKMIKALSADQDIALEDIFKPNSTLAAEEFKFFLIHKLKDFEDRFLAAFISLTPIQEQSSADWAANVHPRELWLLTKELAHENNLPIDFANLAKTEEGQAKFKKKLTEKLILFEQQKQYESQDE